PRFTALTPVLIPAHCSHQKYSFMASWMLRGSRVELTCPLVPIVAGVTGEPGLAALTPVLMPAHCVWLKKLKLSNRKCQVTGSPILVLLKTEQSQLLMPGARRIALPVLPNEPSAGRPKTRGLK